MDEEHFGIGPQSKSGSAFAKKARKHQSEYRANVLKLPYGRGPQRSSRTFYGNMLVNGETTGANFLTTDIFEYAKKRIREKHREEVIEPYRLFNNMLSSQPMCFNLFVPMLLAMELRERWVSDVFAECFPAFGIKQIDEVRVEYIPVPVKNYIGDKSAFDAFVQYSIQDGTTGIIGIETKYIDQLGKNNAAQNDTLLEISCSCGCFTNDGLEYLKNQSPQIVRNFVLTESYRMRHAIDASHSLVLSPNEDKSGIREVAQFKSNLHAGSQSKISHYSLERFVTIVQHHCPVANRKWIDEFERRYLAIGSL